MTTRDGVIIVVQARTGSSRLPGKVLADLSGRPALRLQLDRLSSVACDDLVVATSQEASDDAVANLARDAGANVIRGPEDDVLGRFAVVIEELRPSTVVRLTGDCPFADPGIVEDVVALHRDAEADYSCNILPRSFPKGLDVEVASAAALVAAANEATEAPDREHVTPFLYRRPERFRLANLGSGMDLGSEWWTLDTREDLDRLRAMVSRLDDPVAVGWHEILDSVGTSEVPSAGKVRLRVATWSSPGSVPWRRTWTAELDGRAIGQVDIDVRGGESSCHIEVEPVHESHRTEIAEAVERLLDGDQQSRDLSR